jgi:CRISPR-associated protein Cas1
MGVARLLVASPGSLVSMRRGSVEVRRGGRVELSMPLDEVDAIVVATRGVTVTSQLLVEAGLRGVPVYFVTSRGELASVLEPGEPHRTGATVMAQVGARLDEVSRVRAAKWFVYSKIRARAWLLRYMAKSRGVEALRDLSYVVDSWSRRALTASSLTGLREAEARAGRVYWEAARRHLIPQGLGFEGRRPRGGDPVNSSLDYVYGILRGRCHLALRIAGLNPYVGFMHVEKSGRPSLTLDFMEPYRWLAEKTVFHLLARGWAPEAPMGRLSRDSRRALYEAWAEAERSKIPGTRVSLEQAIKSDAFELASALRESRDYAPTIPQG